MLDDHVDMSIWDLCKSLIANSPKPHARSPEYDVLVHVEERNFDVSHKHCTSFMLSPKRKFINTGFSTTKIAAILESGCPEQAPSIP